MPQPDTVVAVDFGDRQHGPGASAEQRSDAPGISSIGHTAASLYRLLLTDLKLSAGGLGYALFYAALSILALAFVGLFGSGLLVVALLAQGWSWVSALATATGFAGLAALICWRLSRRALRSTGMVASQRQLNALIAGLEDPLDQSPSEEN